MHNQSKSSFTNVDHTKMNNNASYLRRKMPCNLETCNNSFKVNMLQNSF